MAVMKTWSKRHRTWSAHTQAVCRLHAQLADWPLAASARVITASPGATMLKRLRPSRPAAG